MIVIYILSIQSAVFELAQLYETSGFLRIRTSLKMPTDLFQEMGFNPNMETDWNNEAIEYNVKFYANLFFVKFHNFIIFLI